ncbi:hypothetical protein [Streptomyces olivoreticuli]|uniref:hypothetical protein n=1 Tax=Streptomyces olivoreticuli TaxID=68246 RepID=UPI000E272BE3|nr:hypothetical protein [Streptomyces olivoreticuli]
MADPDTPGPADRTGDALVTDLEALIEDTARAAARHGWAAVAEAAAALPERDDRSVLLCASPKADGSALAAHLRTRLPELELRTAPLEPLHTDPYEALRANRVVLALGCAELLSPAAAAAGSALAARPPGTVLVVLTGADALSGDDDLALVARRIWRVLYADADEQWTGRGLAELGCLLWSAEDPADTTEPLHGVLARDAAVLEERLRSAVTAPPELLHDRAVHLLGLAAGLLAGPTADGVAEARAVLESGRRKVLRAVDAETAAAEREIVATLRVVEQDLLRGLGGFLERHRQEVSEPGRARGLVAGYVDRGTGGWAAATVSGLRARAARINLVATEVFQELEQTVAARGVDGVTVGAPPSVSLDGAARGPAAAPGGRPTGGKPSGVPTEMVVGGALGAAAGAVLTSGLGTLLGAGMGAAAGGVLHHRQTELQIGRAAAYGRSAVRERVGALVVGVPAAVRRETEVLRRSTERTLDRIGGDLEAARPREDGPRSARGTDAEAAGALGGLRRRLAALEGTAAAG